MTLPTFDPRLIDRLNLAVYGAQEQASPVAHLAVSDVEAARDVLMLLESARLRAELGLDRPPVPGRDEAKPAGSGPG